MAKHKSKNNFIACVSLDWIINHEPKWTKADIRNAFKEIMNNPGYDKCMIRENSFCMKFHKGHSDAVKAMLKVLSDGLHIGYDDISYKIDEIGDANPWCISVDNLGFTEIINILCYVQR